MQLARIGVPAPDSAAKADGRSLPASPRLKDTLHAHDVRGERAIAVAQGAIAGFVLILHSLAQLAKGNTFASTLVILILGLLVASSALRWQLTKGTKLPERMLGLLSVIDVGIFLALIWSYQFAYGHPAGAILKSPTLALLFVIVALRALRFYPQSILIAGAAAVIGWSLMVAAAIFHDGIDAITRDYAAYLTSHKILIGAEVEKLVALTAMVVLLAAAAWKARGMLSTAAHASDYADALQEATRARQEAEAASAGLGRRDAELSMQNELFNAALENMSQGLCMFDKDMQLLVCNERYTELYGISPDLSRPGTPFLKIIEQRIAAGTYSGEPEQYLAERLSAVREREATLKVQKMRDGRVIIIRHRPLSNGGWLATHDDVTEQHQAAERIAHMANHDALTDLPNRMLLRRCISDALTASTRTGKAFAVLTLDLDRFKEVNDTLGHALGDALLKQVGTRLGKAVSEGDTVARAGADEFVIVRLAGTLADDPVTDASSLAKHVQEILSEPFELDGHRVVVDTSVGIAVAPEDGADPDELLKSADLALHRAKSEGSGLIHFFEDGMDERMQARRQLEQDLRNALVAGEFELHYQPVINLSDESVSGVEALLRWNHPERGVVSPSTFVPLAEETGLIVPIGEWTLRDACAQAVKWPAHIKIAVNISAVHFKAGNLVQSVLTALAATGLAPSRLELEVTETVLLQDNEAAIAMLHRLHDLGVRIALDDFGTGYSSLSYLRSFCFDKIKIDRSFIADLGESNEEALAIIHSVTRLGISLGMETTAEGVETAQQLDVVRAEGCTEAQGFYFSGPLPASQIGHLLEQKRASASAA